MESCKNLRNILKELEEDSRFVNEEEVQKVVDEILEARNLFVCGAGRSGFAARAFSNRLLHLGFHVSFVGEPTTPPIKEGDLLIVCSGSGSTGSLVSNAKKAKENGAKIVLLTISPDSPIGNISEAYITIPGITSKTNAKSVKKETIQPRGSSFEQLTWLICDSIVMYLKERTNQTNDELYARHANME